MALYSAGVRYCAGEIVWHNIDPSVVAGFYIVRVPGIVRVNFRDTYPHCIGPPYCISFRMKCFLNDGTFLNPKSSENTPP